MAAPWRSRAELARMLVLAGALALPVACRAGNSTFPPGQTAGGTGAGAAAGASAGSSAGGPAKAGIPAGKALVIFGSDTVVAEVAKSDAERERGLMYRKEVPAGTGMIFVFPDAEERSFWMENTYVALDIAFMDASLAVVDIQQMEAETTDYHDSKAPAMYALEVPKGWLAAHKIGVGTRARMVVGTG
jgi:uncharacterized membrane protein (UPF0127 family)